MVVWLMALATIAMGQAERWVHRYNGPGNGDDYAYAAVYGADGNIYVAGYSTGSGTGEDFTVISLTPTDSERWVYRCNGSGNGDDAAYSLVFGPDSNIYAVGTSSDSGTGTDFTVISLTPAGTERWVYRYDGPGDSADGGNDLVYAADGNIYAAGGSRGSGTGNDFTVISLTPAGSERWVHRYNGPGNANDYAMRLIYGADGNIYAAGYSTGIDSGWACTVISLTPADSERWVYRYSGPGIGYYYATSLVYGADGSIYLAGSSMGIANNSDFTVISLTPAGSERWVYRYNGPGNGDDEAYSLGYGADGNIYAAGGCVDSVTDYDLTVISLTPADSERWVYRYNGPANSWDLAYSMVCGPDGNIYAAGLSPGMGTAGDLAVASLTPDGSQRWVYRYDGPGLNDDAANSVVYGGDGYVYAAGSSRGIGTGYDIAVISLDPALGVAEGRPRKARPTPGLMAASVQNRVLTYTMKLAEPVTVSLSLYDLQGRRAAGWQLRAPAGTSQYTQSLSMLSSGVYFLSAGVSGRNQTERRKLTVLR
jgi:uncharacterized delta-60 repeat protein